MKCDLAFDGINFEDMAGNAVVSTAGFAVIPTEVGDGHFGLLGEISVSRRIFSLRAWMASSSS